MGKYLEKNFQTDFRKYAKYRLKDKESFVYELKATSKNYINFKALARHQEASLLAVSEGVGHYKIPDEGVSQKPFDGFQLQAIPAYVGVMFNTSSQRKDFYLIKIRDWIRAREDVERASLTEEKALEIGEKHTLA